MQCTLGCTQCSVHSGYSTIIDDDGLPHRVYISVTRDGSVWLRVGPDHTSLDWVYVDERRVHFHSVILSADDIRLLEVLNDCLLYTSDAADE